jgi:hypothetical protein
MGPASSSASAGQSAPGFFLLAWGLFAAVLGLGMVTDFRGFANAFVRSAHASSSWLRRVPPWKWMPREPVAEDLAGRVKRARLIAIPFAVLGPIVTVAGVVQILRGHAGMSRGPALPLPLALGYIGISLFGMAQYWRRAGFFRLAARQGGWMRGAAIVATVGMVSFGGFASLGQTTLGIAGWLVGGLASISLMMSRKSPAVPLRDAPRAQPAGRSSPTVADEDDDDAAFRWL